MPLLQISRGGPISITQTAFPDACPLQVLCESLALERVQHLVQVDLKLYEGD